MVGPVLDVSVIGSDTSLRRAVVRRLHDAGVRVTSGTDVADTLLHVEGDGVSDVGQTRALLRSTPARRLVYTSSAMVYGAWPNNPVPLTEDAPMRPNPGFAYATAKAESERLALEWRDANPDARLAVLRPATGLGGDQARPAHLLRDVRPAGGAEPVPPV